jgi:plasmid replication initiation protein
VADKLIYFVRMKKANGELVAVMANQIARARHALKVQEQRLFLWLVGQVDPFDDEDLQPLRLSVADYAALFGRQGQGSIYQELEEVTTGLLSKVVEIAFPGEARRKKFQWLSKAEYLDGEGVVLVQLHDELKPFLLALKKEFARIPLLEILRLRSRYAMAFYQMCCSWYGSNARSWTLSVEELREWLHIDDGELVKVNHLQSRVIDQARHELDVKARISFRVEILKQGRKIVGWKFKVVDNRPTSVSKGAVRLPDTAAEDEKRRTSERLTGLRLRWTEATDEQRARWLDEMPGHVAAFAPRPAAEPRPIFLLALGDLVEPELPLG